MPTINFTEPPTLGTVLRLDVQEYELVEVRDHTRRDGTAGHILVWRSDCPACGASFDATTGLRSGGIQRRCAEHRHLSNKPVHGKRGRRVKVQVKAA